MLEILSSSSYQGRALSNRNRSISSQVFPVLHLRPVLRPTSLTGHRHARCGACRGCGGQVVSSSLSFAPDSAATPAHAFEVPSETKTKMCFAAGPYFTRRDYLRSQPWWLRVRFFRRGSRRGPGAVPPDYYSVARVTRDERETVARAHAMVAQSIELLKTEPPSTFLLISAPEESKHSPRGSLFLCRANECRVLAGIVADESTRNEYLKLAETYEFIAFGNGASAPRSEAY